MGPKFIIVFTGVNSQDTVEFLKELKQKVESLKFSKNEIDMEENETDKVFMPKLNMVVSSYYKGTSMDSLAKKLEEYLDENNKENSINYI